MPVPHSLRLAALGCALAGALSAQVPPRIYQPPEQTPPANQPPGNQPPPSQPNQTTQPARLTDSRGFLLGGVSLTEMIDILAKMMKINIIIDPRVKGLVTVYTYGEVKPVDLMPFMETILRVNGAAMVKVGEFYRIVPINAISQLPIEPQINVDQKTLPDDERMILNLIFLKYATAAEMDKLLTPFYGEGASHSTYDPANLLILQDNSRNMKRTMDLISMFDADTFAGQRVRLFDVQHSRPSDLVKDLETVFKAYALSEKASAVKFIPIDRINTLIAVAPNPGIFTQVAEWISKLDVPVKVTAGSIDNYVYRLKYGRAETLAMAIMALYSGNPMALAALGAMAANGGMGGMGMGGMGMGYGYGGMGYGGMGYGGMGYGGMGYGGMGVNQYGANAPPPLINTSPIPRDPLQPPAAPDQTGTYMGLGAMGSPTGPRLPHVIPNPFDNTLLIQGTPQEWEQISKLLRQLDVAPRQVLIDAKIYELDLSGAFSSGVQAFLQKAGASGPDGRRLTIASNGGFALSAGALVLRSHELLLAISAAESRNQSRVISSPSIIATDSIAATMNVGQDVPVLTSQAVAGGVQQGGSSVFANTITNRNTGTQLNILARVNSSGVITMQIEQEVSQPQTNTTSDISSPSFSKRSFSTQVTVQDGETIAIGGFIGEVRTNDSVGVPLLHRIPILGAAFGSKEISRSRTELVVFITPRVIYDITQVQDATDEIKTRLRRMQNMIRNDRDQ